MGALCRTLPCSSVTSRERSASPGWILAQKKDFAAYVKAFQRGDTWYVFTRLYLNELAVQESGNAHLSGWARVRLCAGYRWRHHRL